ncbi:nuclease (SNase domain protein) [Parvibaculum lavamentivorans DS-1]|uniref:Nuclease (SNase domain protein) n=1 Tax=Parvibaculum lavamentivorans (strain DS-1 / DSM 13023 / NCIMB 13966) TaxID=402881 RepID=A7HSR7_PARL1|nr:thermonuclease family protein [Parvibaculum lavamentivorans]ABS62950.1 nuclease (SNase domain protein) [Parvibaculum lavamentivorans DS-1]
MRAYLASLFALSAAFPSSAAFAAERLAGPVEAEVVRVIDGDSLVVRARIWLGQTVETHVRLAGIDTPELRGKCEEEKARARAARDALASLTQGRVRLSDIETDKYGGRVLARIESAFHGDVAAALIAKGHARVYDGGARAGWCRLAALPLAPPPEESAN